MPEGLNYHFSIFIILSSLKQFLLLFDSLTVLEPELDDKWLAKWFKNLKIKEGIKYRNYRSLTIPLQELKSEGAIKFISPNELPGFDFHKITTSTISTIIDPKW